MEKLAVKSLVRFQPQTYADLGICLMAVVWGSNSLIQKVTVSHVPPFVFSSARFWVAFAALAIIYYRRFRQAGKSEWKIGILAGCLQFTSSTFFLFGIVYTSVANAVLISNLGVIIIPLLESLLRKKFPSGILIFSASLCTFGLYLLTGWNGTFNIGDFLAAVCAVSYSVYTLVIDRKAKGIEPFSMSTIQILTAAVLTTVIALFTEKATAGQIFASFGGIAFSGIFSSALATPLQVVAQKYTTPNRIGFLLLLEPVVAAILAYLFLHETMSLAGFAGCLIILAGLALAEWKHV